MSDHDMEAAANVIEDLSVRLFGCCQYIQCKKMQTIRLLGIKTLTACLS